MQRKGGGYRKPDLATRVLSLLSEEWFKRFFRQVWTDLPGASTRDHPAPFPVELAARLIRMFSFVGDTVLDPFTGTASTQVAAAAFGRTALASRSIPSTSMIRSTWTQARSAGSVLKPSPSERESMLVPQ